MLQADSFASRKIIAKLLKHGLMIIDFWDTHRSVHLLELQVHTSVEISPCHKPARGRLRNHFTSWEYHLVRQLWLYDLACELVMWPWMMFVDLGIMMVNLNHNRRYSAAPTSQRSTPLTMTIHGLAVFGGLCFNPLMRDSVMLHGSWFHCWFLSWNDEIKWLNSHGITGPISLTSKCTAFYSSLGWSH